MGRVHFIVNENRSIITAEDSRLIVMVVELDNQSKLRIISDNLIYIYLVIIDTDLSNI